MDNKETCSLKDNKKMEANTVWQWRIVHVKRYSRHQEPFEYSDKIGLDFNVGSNTQNKLDLHLVTNGVILEVCDFAKTVQENKRHFITNILENNFDLGLKNEKQRTEFTSQILHKVRDLIQKPPKDKHEGFSLFDTLSEPECDSNGKNGLNMASTEHETDSFLMDMDDTDGSEHEDDFKCSHAASKENIKAEEMDGPHANNSDTEDELECSRPQSTEELREDVLPSSFPCCEEIGLNFDVWSKQSLDPGLLTKGVMLELVHFTRVLTASYRSIVLSVLEHNFELDLKSQQRKNQVWFKISQLLKRRERLISEFESKSFSFETNPFKKGSTPSKVGAPLYQYKEVALRRQSDLKSNQEKRACSTTREQVNKRCRRGQAEQEETNTDLCTSQTANGDDCYMCPLDSDDPTGSDIHSELQSSSLDIRRPFPTTTDGSPSLPIMIQIPNKCDMKQEEMETESNMWKLRAKRGKQILSLLNFLKTRGRYKRFKKIGLEFDVGFGPKKNFSIDSLVNSVLLEVAKFALAMNSSQQDFIMEILEYNFDFGLWSEKNRKTFACEVMKRVRQLKNSDDAVKFSKEIFELPVTVSSVNGENQSVGSVSPEVSSISRTKEHDDVPMCPSDSQAETKDHSVDLYPFCEEIGLKLNVISSQPNKKLEINRLTNGAMTEVTNFAEKLCGTFEQICLDVLRHNFDLDCQSGDSDLARNILDRIPALVEQRNVLNSLTTSRKMNTVKAFSPVVKLDCQKKTNLDTCSAGSFQAPTIDDQNVGTSTDAEQEKMLNLGLWKLRTNQVQQILSVPHGEHCPLYSYSRCKKLGIDFNVGSGVKQNLDPKLLTNGIMAEFNTFAMALQSAEKDFITEILEYNFHLNLNNEFCRQVFAQQVYKKMAIQINKKSIYSVSSIPRMKMLFELPDLRCTEESSFPKTKYCPKCYQDRQYKLHQNESDSVHVLHPRPLATTDTVSAEANCTAQKPADDLCSVLQATEETIMDSYPHCKKIGLSLCVDRDQPKDKLDRHVLTRGVMREVTSFAKSLCGKRIRIINDIIEHNFNLGMQSQYIDPAVQFRTMVGRHDTKDPTWFSEVFVVRPHSLRGTRDVSKVKKASAVHKSERKETIKKRQLALQTKKEEATIQNDNMGVVKAKRCEKITASRFPMCSEIGLDLDVTSKSGDKEKLDLNLLTRSVVIEIYRFAEKQVGRYLPDVVYEILDYNFDISSQHYRRWEFSIATASKVKNIVKPNWKNVNIPDKVFKLPFVFQRKASKRPVKKKQNKSAESAVEDPYKTTKESFVQTVKYHSGVTGMGPWFDNEDTKSLRDHGTIMQMSGSPVSGGCDSLLQGNVQIKEEEYDPHCGDMTPEPDTEVKYHPHCEDVKTESNTEDVKYLVQGEPAEALGYSLVTIYPDSESIIKRELEN